MRSDPRGADVVALARLWIGTPYRHQMSRRGVGADCLGLVRGVWRALYGVEPETPPPYTPDWGEASGDDPLLIAAQRHLVQVARDDARPGDVLLFRLRRGLPAKHMAIKADEGTMIHACQHRAVVEVPLGPWWARRVAGVFRFPGVE
jgi:NlpC/P60 family putative phage cell wall peptidase